MSPHPSITTPPQPLLPRQTYKPNDLYDVSSFYAELSSLYPDLFSSYSYNSKDYTSLMGYYSSLLKSYSLTDYTLPTLTAAATGAGRLTTTGRATATESRSTSTAAAAAASGGEETGSGGGLSTGAKIGIGVGVTLAVLLLAGIGIGLWCMGKRKGKKISTTVVAPAQPNFPAQQQAPQHMQQQPQMGHTNSQGYMPGFQLQQPVVLPPPQYAQPQQPQDSGTGLLGAYGGGYAKGPDSSVAELEHQYHFAKPGIVEMGDGVLETESTQKRTGNLVRKK
ncbi:hypothetical protein CC80DRAFT_546047 [Byssothecium circinans]|uniref:Uncharacterized protein n=1 Tax=Byssothecium circinans TaxID=147558 RepID=A0A6A5U776_9PLEO|nr:hypothetical protein CC80DRAFT_546047 [Byssothecium circinans]